MEENKFPNFNRQKDSIENHEKMITEWAAETIASEKHPNQNQDSILTNEALKAFGVFDGVAGDPAGDLASQIARDYISLRLKEISDSSDINIAKQQLLQIMIDANKLVYEASISSVEHQNMATTATMVKIHTDNERKNYAMITNAGDSRVYKIDQNGKIQQITVDDSVVGNYIADVNEKLKIEKKIANARTEADLATPNEKFFYKKRNQITNCLGLKSAGPIKVDVIPVEKGDRFLLTSDGIHDNLTTDEIEEIIQQSSTIQDAVNNLKEKSLERSRETNFVEMRAKPDDMSVILVSIE